MADEAYDYISTNFYNSSNTANNELNKLVTKFKRLEAESNENLDS